MRPSKFLFPESTEATVRSFSLIAVATGSGRGPLLPIHVVQPYPTIWKRRASRKGISPAFSRYSLTTRDPGAKLVLTHGFTCKPLSTAFLATIPAPIKTNGLEVLVQLVIAARTKDPSPISTSSSPMVISTFFGSSTL